MKIQNENEDTKRSTVNREQQPGKRKKIYLQETLRFYANNAMISDQWK